MSALRVTDAYLAGLFDGEGSITLWRQSGKNDIKLEIAVTMADQEPINLLQNEFGGAVTRYEPRTGQNYPSYRWRPQSSQALPTLLRMLPYLIVKRAQAELAIEFACWKGAGQRGRAYSKAQLATLQDFLDRMKALKPHGQQTSYEKPSTRTG